MTAVHCNICNRDYPSKERFDIHAESRFDHYDPPMGTYGAEYLEHLQTEHDDDARTP